jgi:hypothetical protein
MSSRVSVMILLAMGLLIGGAAVRTVAADDPPKPGENPPPRPGIRKATDAERKSATEAIEAQLKAFKADDYVKAMKYQSEGLRQGVSTPEAFKRMMRQAYPQFANYKSVTFGESRCTDDGTTMQIEASVTGQDNILVKALYVMVKEQGEYRVGSVYGGVKTKPSPKEII